jgi:two-component system response regulator AtoC
MTQAPPKAKTILIVEDDPDTSFTLAEILRDNGYEVSTAIDRDDAESIMASCRVDLILLDYMMPGQSASKFLLTLNASHPDIRIVLITAGNRVAEIARMLGIREFVGKPVIPEELLKVLNKKPSSRHKIRE